MIPYPFNYKRAASVAEAVALLGASPEGKLLAGGQTLIAAMKMRLANPSDLIDISNIAALNYIRVAGGKIAIGAATTHHQVASSTDIAKAIPALKHLASIIGDPAVRYKGTLGGSVANNDPAADYPAAVLGLGATVTTDRRAIAADDFFQGMFATALEEGEIVTEVAFPIPQQAAYRKFQNPASRYAMVGVFVAKLADGTVRVAVTGAAPCVFRAPEMEAALAKSFTPDAIAGLAVDAANMNSDIHGSAEYRAHLVTVMAARAVADAA